MARVKIEEILDSLSLEISKALEEAVHDELPGTAIDRVQLFRAFIGAVRRKCSTWESVPDQYVEVDGR